VPGVLSSEQATTAGGWIVDLPTVRAIRPHQVAGILCGAVVEGRELAQGAEQLARQRREAVFFDLIDHHLQQRIGALPQQGVDRALL
jgi:hypothetical protein